MSVILLFWHGWIGHVWNRKFIVNSKLWFKDSHYTGRWVVFLQQWSQAGRDMKEDKSFKSVELNSVARLSPCGSGYRIRAAGYSVALVCLHQPSLVNNSSRTGVSNLQPANQMQPVEPFHLAHQAPWGARNLWVGQAGTRPDTRFPATEPCGMRMLAV